MDRNYNFEIGYVPDKNPDEEPLLFFNVKLDDKRIDFLCGDSEKDLEIFFEKIRAYYKGAKL